MMHSVTSKFPECWHAYIQSEITENSAHMSYEHWAILLLVLFWLAKWVKGLDEKGEWLQISTLVIELRWSNGQNQSRWHLLCLCVADFVFQPEGSLLRDQFTGLQKRNIIEPRKPAKWVCSSLVYLNWSVASVLIPGGHSLHSVKNRWGFTKGIDPNSSPFFASLLFLIYTLNKTSPSGRLKA